MLSFRSFLVGHLHCRITLTSVSHSIGSRISYDRNTLLNLANSPLARTPPSGLAFVPGVTKVNQLEGHLAPPQQPLFPGMQHRSTPTQHHESKGIENADKSTERRDNNGKELCNNSDLSSTKILRNCTMISMLTHVLLLSCFVII